MKIFPIIIFLTKLFFPDYIRQTDIYNISFSTNGLSILKTTIIVLSTRKTANFTKAGWCIAYTFSIKQLVCPFLKIPEPLPQFQGKIVR